MYSSPKQLCTLSRPGRKSAIRRLVCWCYGQRTLYVQWDTVPNPHPPPPTHTTTRTNCHTTLPRHVICWPQAHFKPAESQQATCRVWQSGHASNARRGGSAHMMMRSLGTATAQMQSRVYSCTLLPPVLLSRPASALQ